MCPAPSREGVVCSSLEMRGEVVCSAPEMRGEMVCSSIEVQRDVSEENEDIKPIQMLLVCSAQQEWGRWYVRPYKRWEGCAFGPTHEGEDGMHSTCIEGGGGMNGPTNEGGVVCSAQAEKGEMVCSAIWVGE